MLEISRLLETFTPQGDQEISDFKIFCEFAKDPRNLTRESIAHFTASAFIINESHDKALAIFHKIFQSWGWLGGHADGEADLLKVARKEAQEESGLKTLRLLEPSPISIEAIPVFAHVHRTRGYVSSHLHLNVTFLFEANKKESLVKNEVETAGITWLSLSEFVERSTENEMKPIYEKIISRIPKK